MTGIKNKKEIEDKSNKERKEAINMPPILTENIEY